MTRAEFITESLSFEPGSIVVVSGKDFSAVHSMLVDAQSAIEGSTSNLALVYDSRQTFIYAKRDNFTNVTQAILWEWVALMSESQFVVLVANQFDPADPAQNPHPSSIEADVVLDLIEYTRVKDLPYAYQSKYGVREIFAFINKIYFHDTDTGLVSFVKSQRPDRPP